MAGNFPVDENNLSFSDDDVSSLFITQSTFHDISTQVVSEAVDFLDGLSGELSTGEVTNVMNKDSGELSEDWCDHKSVQYFDFSHDVDNGYEVSTQELFILTCHYDGKQFVVNSKNELDVHDCDDGKLSGNVTGDVKYDDSNIESDLKHFGDAVDQDTLDSIQCKR